MFSMTSTTGRDKMICNFCDRDKDGWIIREVPGMGAIVYCDECQKKYLANCVKKKLRSDRS